MNSRERFGRAMAGQPVDRVPLDIGGTSLTGMRPGCQRRLCQLLGFEGPAPPGTGAADPRLLEWAGTDFRPVGGIVSLPGPHARRLSETAWVDCWGIRHDVVGGEAQITVRPLDGASLDDLRAFPWPAARVDDALLERWTSQARGLQDEGRYVVVAEHPVFGLLELGCWMCGYGDFLLRVAAEPDFVRLFFERVLEIQLAVVEQYYGALGPYVDLTTSGDDFGSQRGPLLSPGAFAALIAPPFATRIARTRELTGGYYWHHTCGSVAALLESLVECGVDILNPVQTSAADMEPASLKARFGDRVAFWGAVDVQQFLPRATPGEVRDEVRRLAAVLGEGGGYVMAPAHEMQEDVPVENVVAWVETMRATESNPHRGGE